ncbi:Proteinase R [Holothuria leucospilota]|uniref:Proteinase R n=1 Tax=Holothuria leucospilota TaxID=206669 RepID=A0A9Q1HLQ5_HOLLE|nr:Proteinase R [Holothuria leucospilota]
MKFLLITLLAAAASSSFAPLHKAKERIDGSYIVMLKNGESLTAAVDTLRDSPFFSLLGGRIDIVYDNSLNAFAATLSEKALNMIRRWDIVEYVEEDGIYRVSAVGSWGIDRIDQRNLPLDNSYVAPRAGAGQTVYVVDTGIRHSHDDFGERASYHWDYQSSNGGEDCNGHGTTCAGIVGGATYGVAPSVSLKSVRVASCFGSSSTSNLINGLNSIPGNGVVSMAIGGGGSSSIDNAVADAVIRGIVVVVPAGSSNANACNYSPSREPSAITVGATDSSDERSSFSNYGTCVDIFAPGSSITSTWHTSDTATITMSGTSLACSHVAGAAALLLVRGVSASNVPSTITSEATSGVVSNPGTGSPNLLLYVQ